MSLSLGMVANRDTPKESTTRRKGAAGKKRKADPPSAGDKLSWPPEETDDRGGFCFTDRGLDARIWPGRLKHVENQVMAQRQGQKTAPPVRSRERSGVRNSGPTNRLRGSSTEPVSRTVVWCPHYSTCRPFFGTN